MHELGDARNENVKLVGHLLIGEISLKGDCMMGSIEMIDGVELLWPKKRLTCLRSLSERPSSSGCSKPIRGSMPTQKAGNCADYGLP